MAVIVKKFAVPVLFTLLGIGVLVVGVRTKQDFSFNMAAVFLFVAAILSVMYSSGKFKSSLINMLGVVAALGAAVTIYFSFKSVSDTAKYNERYKLMMLKAEQNLSDVRFIQEKHAEQKGRYAANWDEFKAFAEVATVDHVIAEGSLPARKMTQDESRYVYKDNRPVDKSMTEKEAWILSKWEKCPQDLVGFVRDTVKLNMMKIKFQNDAYEKSRIVKGIGHFSIDSLPVIPFTSTPWTLETVDSVMVGDQKIPTIRVSGRLPYAEIQGGKPKEMFFGDLTSNNNDGSWE